MDFDFKKESEIIKNAFNEFKKTKNKTLKEMIRIKLLYNAYTYTVLNNNELNSLKKPAK